MQSQRLNSHLLFFDDIHGVNGTSWTLYSTNDTWYIGHFHCDSKRQQMCIEQLFMLILKKNLFHRSLNRLNLIWVGFSGVCFEVGGKITPCLKLVRIMLET